MVGKLCALSLLHILVLTSKPAFAQGRELGNVWAELATNEAGLFRDPCTGATICLVTVSDPRESEVPFHLKSTRGYDDVMFNLAVSATFLGGSACARELYPDSAAVNQLCDGAYRVILFGYDMLHMYQTELQIPRHSFFYNLISVHSVEWRNLPRETISLMKYFRVFDPSWANVRLLRDLSINATYVPIGNSDGLTIPTILHTNKDMKDLDVLLFGGCSERHCSVARVLSDKGFKAYVVSFKCKLCPTFSKDTSVFLDRMQISELYAQAKIIANLYPYADKPGAFKLASYTYMLANDMFVVSETGSDKFAEEQVEGGVIFTPADGIVKTCEYFLNSPEERNKISKFSFDMIRQLSNVQQLRCPLFGRLFRPRASKITQRKFSRMVATKYRHSSLLAFSQAFVPPDCFHVIAIMAGYNEADVLESSIMDLIEQGCDVHYLDNWSDDDSVIRIQQLQRRYPNRIKVEMFPVDGKTSVYNWAAILQRKAELASSLKADWFLHVDPDELRESPWGRTIPLRQALYIVSELGFNVVNFGKLLVFRPIKGSSFLPGQNLRTSFLHFEYNMFAGDSVQVKAWKSYYRSCTGKYELNRVVNIDLVSSGGHRALYKQLSKKSSRPFPPFKLFPYNFILRHYPVRSQEHGKRKIFTERRGRWNETEKNEWKWHRQYDNLNESDTQFLVDNRVITMTYPNGDLPYDIYADSSLPCPHRFYVPHTLFTNY